MTTIVLLTFWGTVGFVIVQTALVALFIRQLRTETEIGEADVEPDSIAIILCVRGLDPSLDKCLQSLIDQRGQKEKIFVVADSADDPALELVDKYQQKHPQRIQVLVNDEILETCGLKCSNLVFAMRKLESEFSFFVLVDADTVPPPDWLMAMTSPFQDEKVCVSTGVRWVEATGTKLGTWVRYIWNTAAIVQMVCYRIPWGGSLAVRTTFLREADVLDAWSRGFCEDTMLQSLVKRFGGKVEVVPQAIIRNDEETSLGSCVPWISRQLLTARLHHPKWPLVMGHGLLTAYLTWIPLVFGAICLGIGNYSAAGWSLATYLLLQASNLGLLLWIEAPVRDRLDAPVSLFHNPCRFLFSMLVTQIAYPWAMLRAIFARKVEWRQIEYRIRGRRVEMVDYQPYQQSGTGDSL